MKIIKLISNKAAAAIKAKHTQEEIDNGIAKLVQVNHLIHHNFLKEKLLEEAAEYLVSGSEDELDDIIEVCRALKGKKTKFSGRWALATSRGHYKNEKD